MKIVYFNYMWDLWGLSIGSTIKALELLKALSNSGHEIKKYWRNDSFERKSGQPLEEGGSFRSLMKKYFKRYLHEPSQLMKNINWINEELAILEEEKPDLVISRVASYCYSPVKVSQKSGIPYLIEADSPASYEKVEFQKYFRSTKSLLYWIENKQIMSGKAAFTVSNQIKQYFVGHGIPSDFMSVIPNGADAERFAPTAPCEEVKQKYDLQDSVVIGFVGSFIYWHGIENLTYVIEKILSMNKRIKFLMVGEGGPMKPMLDKFIRDHKLQDRAILTGFVSHDEIPKYIAAMDIVLAPYPKLDFFYYSPVKIYEYMSVGKPVVSTAIGQIAEIIDDRRNGFLTQPDDVEKITSTIIELVNKPELRQKVGAAARKDVLEKYTWKKRGEQLSELCRKCVG